MNLIQYIAPFLFTAGLFSQDNDSRLGPDDWPNWRGPFYNGSASEQSLLPTDFGPEKSIKWKVSLPGPSAATPIIVNGKVFISSISISEDPNEQGKGDLLALCFDREEGTLLWQRSAGSGYRPSGDGFDFQLHDKSNYASPSPVSDGKNVIFFYGNGDLVSYSIKGVENWRRNLQQDYGDFCFQWTFSSSPTLHNGKLYLPILQRNEPVHGRGVSKAKSFLLCMNPEDGTTIWKHDRPSEAKKESLESFGTIIPHREQLVVAGGDVLTGHDPLSGKELWRWGTWNENHKQEWWRLVPSPVFGGGVFLVCAPKKAPVFAIKSDLVGTHSGSKGVVWKSKEQGNLTSDVPTPLFYEKRFFLLSDVRKTLSKVDPSNGNVEWSLALPGKYRWRSSPTGGGGVIYLMNHNGEVLVVSSHQGKVLNSAKLGSKYEDNVRSSVAISKGQLFVRTNENLYCID